MLPMRLFIFSLFFFLCCASHLVSHAVEVVAPKSQKLPSDIEKILNDAKANRQEAMKERFNPILQDLARRSDLSYEGLYLDAVYGTFFAKEPKPDKAFQDWQRKNKGLLDDTRLALATQLASLNLQGHIHLILGNEDRAVGCFVELLRGITRGGDDIAGFHLMQESLQDTLLVKFYGIEADYLKEGNHYMGAMSNVEELFKAHVLPWYETHQPKEIGSMWDIAIAATGRVACVSDQKVRQFNLSDCPKLMVSKAESLEKAGQQAEAIEVVKIILGKYPEYPKFNEVAQKLKELSTKK